MGSRLGGERGESSSTYERKLVPGVEKEGRSTEKRGGKANGDAAG